LEEKMPDCENCGHFEKCYPRPQTPTRAVNGMLDVYDFLLMHARANTERDICINNNKKLWVKRS